MQIIQSILTSAGGTAAAIALMSAALSLVEVSKIHWNPWSAIRQKVGAFFGAEHGEKIAALEERLETIENLLKQHIRDSDQRNADECRRRILAFEREIQWDVKHSGEDFEDILGVIRQYEAYCTANPDYKNHIAAYAIQHIGEVYAQRLRKHDFLKEGKNNEVDG